MGPEPEDEPEEDPEQSSESEEAEPLLSDAADTVATRSKRQYHRAAAASAIGTQPLFTRERRACANSSKCLKSKGKRSQKMSEKPGMFAPQCPLNGLR